MKSLLASLFGVKYSCPQCGAECRVNPMVAAVRGVTCADCSLRTDQFHHQQKDGEDVIHLAATPQGGIAVLIPIAFFSFLAAGAYGANVILIALPVAYVALSLLMGFLLRRPLMRLGNNQLVIEPRALSSAGHRFDCSPENDPHVTIIRTGKGAALHVNAGEISESISLGLRQDEWDRLHKIIDDYFASVRANAPDVPALVVEAEDELEHRHPVILRDESPPSETGKLDRSGTNSVTAPCKVVVKREGKGLIVRTAIDWTASRNKNCIALAVFVFVLTATPMLVPFLDNKISWHAFIVPGLFAIPILLMFHTWIIGLCTEIRRKEITVSYYFLGIPVWWRRFSVKDVRQVVPSWANGIALETTKGSVRILHCPNRKVRNNTLVLLQRKLSYLGWVEELPFSVKNEAAPLIVDLKPWAVDVFIERFNVPPIIVAVAGVPLCLVLWGVSRFLLPNGIVITIVFSAIVLVGLFAFHLMLSRLYRTACQITVDNDRFSVEWSRDGKSVGRRELFAGNSELKVNVERSPAVSRDAIIIRRGVVFLQIGSRMRPEDQRVICSLIRNALGLEDLTSSLDVAARPAATGAV